MDTATLVIVLLIVLLVVIEREKIRVAQALQEMRNPVDDDP